ncbi:MAG: hypothetical protein ACFFDY_04795, partial [Candidatus Thorarchaeota archaeon]
NIPILHHTISNLINLKIKKIGIVIGYLGKKISNFISKLIKENEDLQEKLQIINAKKQYKLGPLYSFLSITKKKNFFTKDKYYLVLPGDTVFENNIIDEILSSISNNYTLIKNYPFVFYRNIETSKLIELYNINRLISNAEIEIIDSNIILKQISLLKVGDIANKDSINQIIPIIVLNYNAIIEISNIRKTNRIKTIWEALNHLAFNEKKIICFKIEKDYHFFDIDIEEDIQKLKKKRKGQ